MSSRQVHRSDNPLAVLREYLSGRTRHGMVERCRDGGRCQLILDREAVCISCDDTYLLEGYAGKRPDFFIATVRGPDDVFCWVVAEMKSGTLNPTGVHAQLQSGARCIEQSELPTPRREEFTPVAVRGDRGLRTSDRQLLDRLKVTYRGVNRTILIERCGASLSGIVERDTIVARRS